MNRSSQLICAHSAWILIVLMSVGLFGIAGWMPLIPPDMSSSDLASEIAANRTRIRIGMTLLALSGAFWWTFSAAISMQLKRIEGKSHPWTYVNMASSSGTSLIIMLAGYFWLVAAYREDTSLSLIHI